jgi:hypothetical protein
VLKGWSSIWFIAGRSVGEEERSSRICGDVRVDCDGEMEGVGV